MAKGEHVDPLSRRPLKLARIAAGHNDDFEAGSGMNHR